MVFGALIDWDSFGRFQECSLKDSTLDHELYIESELILEKIPKSLIYSYNLL